MTTAETITGWSRRFVVTSVLFLVLWQAGVLLGVDRQTGVVLGVLGFVLHVVFGKAYALVPSYFAREFSITTVQPVHYGLTVGGTLLLAIDAQWQVSLAGTVGSVLWALGVIAFLGALGWTIRDNPIGTETGTGAENADRRGVDRMANAFMIVALAYLLLASYDLLALHTGVPALVASTFPRVAHLFAAGAATMLVFAIGFRLLPRFLVAHPPLWLVPIVLSAGAVGPLLLARTLGTGTGMLAGATIEAIAVMGFAIAYAVLFIRSDRRRVGFYGVLAGVTAGYIGVLLGIHFALGGVTTSLATAHYRLNVLGFLGLTVIGVTYQFYPPTIGSFPGASDRSAYASIAAIGAGLLLEVLGLAGGDPGPVSMGRTVSFLGVLVYAGLVIGVIVDRSR